MLQRHRVAQGCLLAVLCLAAAAAHATSNTVEPNVQAPKLEAHAPAPPQLHNNSEADAINVAQLPYSGLNGLKVVDAAKQQRLADIHDENVWKNDLIMWILPDSYRETMPHWTQSWFRLWVMATTLYFVVGAAWAYYCYFCFGDRLYPPGHIPTMPDMLEQMKVAFFAMPLYALLPAATEAVVEQGWTLSYSRISDVGIPMYCLYFALYMTSVEFFVYWQHRLLHDIHAGYRHLHHIHHKYNKEHTLSPFAGLAFHPIDGILQALPYSWTLFFVPMHFLTHELLLFATAIWTTNIHDCIHGKVDPIMGAGYHTIHHTTYKHNYGHYFIYMDKIFGTLITPEAFEEKHRDSGSKTD